MSLSFDQTMRLLKELDEQSKLVGPKGVGEALLNTAGQTAVEAGAGLSGLWELIKGNGLNSAVDAIDTNRQDWSSMLPELSPQGQQAMSNAEEVFGPVGRFLQESGQNAGDFMYEQTGSPAIGAAVQTGVQGLPELIGLGAITKPRVARTGMPAVEDPVMRPQPRPEAPQGLLGEQRKLPAPQGKLPRPMTPREQAAQMMRDARPAIDERMNAFPEDFMRNVFGDEGSITPKSTMGGGAIINDVAPYERPLKEPAQPKGLIDRPEYSQPNELGFTSKLENALIDIKNTRGDKQTLSSIGKQLTGRGVSSDEINFAFGMRNDLNRNNEVVSITGLLGDINPVERRLSAHIENSNTAQDAGENPLYDMEDVPFETLDREDAYGIDEYEDNYQFLDQMSYDSSRKHKLAEWISQNAQIPVDDAKVVLSDAYNAAGDDPDYFIASVQERLGFGADSPDFRSYFEDKAGEFAEINYNNAPVLRYENRIEDADGDLWDVDIIGSDETGYRIMIDGNEVDNGNIYSQSEAMIQAQDYLRDRGFSERMGGEVRWTDDAYTIGYVDEDAFRENVVLTMDDLDYENSTHWSGVEGPVAHLRASERQTVDGDNVYFVDEMQSDLHSDARKTGKQLGKDGAMYSDWKTEARARDTYLAEEQAKANARKKLNDLRLSLEDYDSSMGELYGQFNMHDLEDLRILTPNVRDHVEARLGMKADEILDTPISKLMEIDENAAKIILNRLDMELEPVAKMDAINKTSKYDFGEGKYDQYVKSIVEAREAGEVASRAARENRGPQDAPLKDDKWVGAMMRQSIIRAIENGNDRVVFSNADDHVSVWSERYRKGYDKVYNKTLPKELKKLGDKYGVKPEMIEMQGMPEEFENKKRWSIKITPEMKEAINKRGLDMYGKVNKGLLRQREEKSLQGGLMEGAKYYA